MECSVFDRDTHGSFPGSVRREEDEMSFKRSRRELVHNSNRLDVVHKRFARGVCEVRGERLDNSIHVQAEHLQTPRQIFELELFHGHAGVGVATNTAVGEVMPSTRTRNCSMKLGMVSCVSCFILTLRFSVNCT